MPTLSRALAASATPSGIARPIATATFAAATLTPATQVSTFATASQGTTALAAALAATAVISPSHCASILHRHRLHRL